MKNIPLYKYSAAYAKANGELDVFRASNKANIACKEAIENAIRTHYSNNTLDPAGVMEVDEAFGVERMLYVLAVTVQHALWDMRYCPSIKEWAKTIYVYEELHSGLDDHAEYYRVNAHPGLVDLFIRQTLQVV